MRGRLALAGKTESFLESGGSSDDSDATADPVHTPADPLPENIFSVAITCWIRDTKWLLSEGMEQGRFLKFWRLSFTVVLTVFALGLQMYLIHATKTLITPDVVKSIRSTYQQYEHVMYTDYETGTTHTTMTVNGFERGVPGYFNSTNFQYLDPKLKKNACRIPLSQPLFYFVIMAIWTVTCLADMRENGSIMVRLLCRAETITSMKHAIEECDGGHEVVGLTVWMKIFLLFGIGLPRLLLTSYLLWLGGRWLCATFSFADLLLNAVALEFILLFKELLYNTIVPHSTKVQTQSTLVPHLVNKEGASARSYFGMFILLALALIYAWLYMYHLQTVLPQYRWDVTEVCVDYLKSELEEGAAGVQRRSPTQE